MTRGHLLDSLRQDLRYALRGICRSPGFALAVVLTLGLGIGINAVAFGAVDALLLRAPAGVGDPDGVYRIDIRPPVGRGQAPLKAGTLGVTYPEFAALRDDGAFATLATYFESGVTLGRGPQAEQHSVVYVSREYFSTLRARPALGQLFAPGPERELPPAAVLSYDYWHSRFGADPGVVGRPLEVDGHTVVVLGVAGQGFNGVRQNRRCAAQEPHY